MSRGVAVRPYVHRIVGPDFNGFGLVAGLSQTFLLRAFAGYHVFVHLTGDVFVGLRDIADVA
jgi:hypothetical protein